jgi:hypothetical protein
LLPPSTRGTSTKSGGTDGLFQGVREPIAGSGKGAIRGVADGRVNYEDASRRFTLMADRCIIMSKRLISAIMKALNLPRTTKVRKDTIINA